MRPSIVIFFRRLGVIHIVNAFTIENGVSLGQHKVYRKFNKITATPELLELLEHGYWEPSLCPKCGGDVISHGARRLKGKPGLRRRRECVDCHLVFYTVEILETPVGYPIKR